MKSFEGRLYCVQADLEVESDIEKAFRHATTAFNQPVQVVVINHGYWESEDVPVAKMTLKQWNATISIDLTSPFMVAREYLKGLEQANSEQKEKAAMVLIGSTAGKYGEANHADYAACKSGTWPCMSCLPNIAHSDCSLDVWPYPLTEERDCRDSPQRAREFRWSWVGVYADGGRSPEGSRSRLSLTRHVRTIFK